MIKLIKRNFKVIIVVILSVSITVFAEGIIKAKDITFTPKNENWKVNNLEDAINDLYENNSSKVANNYVKDGLEINVDYRARSMGYYGDNITVTDDGYYFNGAQYIKGKRYQNSYMTYEAYVKITSLESSNQKIISSTENGGCALKLQSSTLIGECFVGGNYVQLINKIEIEKDKWYHIVLSAGVDGMKLFVNGQMVADNTYKSVGLNQSSTITLIGAEPSGSSVSGHYLKGYIKFVRVYNRGLTKEEVLQNYNDAITNY